MNANNELLLKDEVLSGNAGKSSFQFSLIADSNLSRL